MHGFVPLEIKKFHKRAMVARSGEEKEVGSGYFDGWESKEKK